MPSFKDVQGRTFLNDEFFYRKTRFCLETLTSCQRSDVLGVRLKLAVNTDTDVRGFAQKRCFLLKQKTSLLCGTTDIRVRIDGEFRLRLKRRCCVEPPPSMAVLKSLLEIDGVDTRS